MTLRLLAAVSPGELRVALLRGDELIELAIERPALPDGVGDVQRARVAALAPAMSGAFIALVDGTTAFLPETETTAGRGPIGRVLQEGQLLVVRVTRAAQGGKGPRVTARLSEAEALLAAQPGDRPGMLARGPDAALRLARLHPAAAVETDGAALAVRLRAELGAERVRLVAAPVFDDAIEAELETLAGPEVPLAGGGRLLIHPTPAMVAIDVDAGAAAGSRDRAAQDAVNRAAITEAARQIRLRTLSGAILIDLAGLPARGRDAMVPAMAAAVASDRLAECLGTGPLGLIELRRRRVHPPLHEVLGAPPSALTEGLGGLRRAVREAAARPGQALAMTAHPAVVAALEGLRGALAEYAEAAGTPLVLRAERGRRLDEIDLGPAGGT